MNTLTVQSNNNSNSNSNSSNNKQRGHIRSASLENANSFIAKNTLGLPIVQVVATGTLKSRNEQKHLRNKFGSHSNLEDYVTQTRSKFQNIRQMFEANKMDAGGQQPTQQQPHSLQETYSQSYQQQPVYSHQRNLQMQQAQPQQQQQQLIYHQPKNAPPLTATSIACPTGAVEFNDRLNIVEAADSHSTVDSMNCGGEKADQATNLIRPIAFKPIPFEPDYSIPNRYIDACDRYGSTPSLAPVQGSGLRFGSTSDLRHGGGSFAANTNYNNGNYCSSLLVRRRCSRSMKINDSMESIRQTPDSDATSQSSTLKSIGSINSKYIGNDQFDMTPSPSDSGISELEAALKDRDSELSYLRQTMEHNEKDKEEYWENETKRIKAFYENQQRDYMLKMKKMEQMLVLQSFQFKQNKFRITENSNRLKNQFVEMKNENEMLRSENENLKTSDRAMRDCVVQLEDKIRVMHNMMTNLKSQLEENEWTVCQKNGEIALLKTQLKDANVELTMKEHEIVHMKHEISNSNSSDSQLYQSIDCNKKNHPSDQKSSRAAENENHQLVPSSSPSSPSNDIEISQLNKIIILKDQVILALTTELGKLRKELSDLAIFHEYGEEPSGKLTRLKYQIENLSNICNKSKKSTQIETHPQDKVIDDANLELIMNCLKMSPELCEQTNTKTSSKSIEEKLNTVVRLQETKETDNAVTNLPDVTQNHNQTNLSLKVFEPCTANSEKMYVEGSKMDEIETLRCQLNETRANFEAEKQQWAEEKEKVLSYQRQLQMHYINMYHKMISLDGSNV